jgi:hypothetical protein
VVNEVEGDVGGRERPSQGLNLERGSGLVAGKEQPEVRLALTQDHDLAVEDDACREVE